MAGCGDNGPQNKMTAQTTGLKDVLESRMSEENTEVTSAPSETTDPSPTPDPLADYSAESLGQDGIDYDLTKLSSDLIYAEVYNMMIFPKEYIGRTVKVSGVFTVYYDEAKDKYHFACFVSDAAACCQQGIEFILEGDNVYPEDYPAEGAEITITGVFGTYEEDGGTYWSLTGARFI
jgi:hypothetical protein